MASFSSVSQRFATRPRLRPADIKSGHFDQLRLQFSGSVWGAFLSSQHRVHSGGISCANFPVVSTGFNRRPADQCAPTFVRLLKLAIGTHGRGSIVDSGLVLRRLARLARLDLCANQKEKIFNRFLTMG